MTKIIKRISVSDMGNKIGLPSFFSHYPRSTLIYFIYGPYRNKILKLLSTICQESAYSKSIEYNPKFTYMYNLSNKHKIFKTNTQYRLKNEWPYIFIGNLSDDNKFLLRISYDIDVNNISKDSEFFNLTNIIIQELEKRLNISNLKNYIKILNTDIDVSDEIIISKHLKKGVK